MAALRKSRKKKKSNEDKNKSLRLSQVSSAGQILKVIGFNVGTSLIICIAGPKKEVVISPPLTFFVFSESRGLNIYSRITPTKTDDECRQNLHAYKSSAVSDADNAQKRKSCLCHDSRRCTRLMK